ncbi:MAG TPA: glycosyltransferase [Oscillospiraceae bacterium]|nr:glycosyltransferase [Oscillospiraceae bacterium]HPF55775.1 glycosyltransferase [Clostridiales bacterium]HPK35846.1 glycosyltransferase [Oscillospiraceae bacterium]HPR76011.1 glycosyltransferase [Oscillospiraceae bacterium]
MRIGEFTDSFLPIADGVGRVVLGYAQTLGSKGHDCYVITPMGDTGCRGKYPFEIVDFSGMPLPQMPQYRAGMPLLDQHYHNRMDMIEFDIVHVHSPFTAGQEGLRIAKKQSVPLVGTFHSKYYDDFLQVTKQEVIADVGVKYVVAFYEKCDEVWAVSEASAETLKSYGYSRDVIVMPNGTDVRKPVLSEKEKALQQYSPHGDPILLFVGQLNWKKNILHILEAAASLKKSGLKFRLVLAGQGPHRSEIEKKCKELEIDDLTILPGHILDTAKLDGLYQAASLFVFPSIYDNAPMVIREAAAMGTASLVTRGSSSAENIVENENGLLSVDNSMALARTIEDALKNPKKLAELGKNAQKTIPVSWDELLDTVLERYQRLIGLYL